MANRAAATEQVRRQAPPAGEPDTRESEDDSGDHLLHIICMVCYPAFADSREAPHDAVCICGKLLRKGEMPGPSSRAQCILCNEMWEHHRRTMHPDE